ncbi:hypothetical protein NRIC_22400 [Enterococcus florum]|uniref:HTH cro/C1-type domain-containing protein n=1 Tax=Enterococcus florum TaxID=2480627 RepID=A0A4V0WPM2_9ENTE|nr:helix-turn-helix transcriptional regulator [Enterococcus florum]GCF94349.1 hypothetical protein NRIC_22400 [Enterococcus florum]
MQRIRLREVMAGSDLSLEELSKATGVDFDILAQFYYGGKYDATVVPVESLTIIADTLNVNLAELMDFSS